MKKLTVIFLCLLLASVTLGCGKKNGIRKYKHLLRNEGRYLVLQ